MQKNSPAQWILSKGREIYVSGLLGTILALFLAPRYLVSRISIAVFGIVVMWLGIWVAQNTTPQNKILAFIKRHIAILVFLLSAAISVAMKLTLNDQPKVTSETHEMTWSYGKYSGPCSQCKKIVLRFVDKPDRFIAIYSRDLGDYLESLGTDRVSVVFEQETESSSSIGPNEVKIGELKEWQTEKRSSGEVPAPMIEELPW